MSWHQTPPHKEATVPRSPIGDVIEGAHRAAADIATERITDPLTGHRSPLGYTDEAEPFFAETLNATGFPWYASGTPFPSRMVVGTATDVVDEPPTMQLAVVRKPRASRTGKRGAA